MNNYTKNHYECIRNYVDDAVNVFLGNFNYFESRGIPEIGDEKIK
jgi:hypothetical protein